MHVFFLRAAADPDSAWARRLHDVMMSWPALLVILLLWASLALLLVLHARRAWDEGLRDTYLLGGLTAAGVFSVAQSLFASGLVGDAGRPDWPFVVESVVLVALCLYAFARRTTDGRTARGGDEVRARGAALDRVTSTGAELA